MSTGRGDVDAAVAGLRARWGAAAPGVVGALALAPTPADDVGPIYDPQPDDRVIRTGFAALDAILGPGGLPKSASVAIRGDGSSGRTTLSLRVAAEAQATGSVVAWLDLSRSFDPVEAVARGVRLEWLVVITPASLDEGLSIAGSLLAGRSVDLLVLDLPGGRLARTDKPSKIADRLHRLAALARRAETLLLILDAPGLAGGLATAVAQSTGIRLELARRSWVRLGRDVVGQRTEALVAHNRHGLPGRRATLRILYAEGGERDACLRDDTLLVDTLLVDTLEAQPVGVLASDASTVAKEPVSTTRTGLPLRQPQGTDTPDPSRVDPVHLVQEEAPGSTSREGPGDVTCIRRKPVSRPIDQAPVHEAPDREIHHATAPSLPPAPAAPPGAGPPLRALPAPRPARAGRPTVGPGSGHRRRPDRPGARRPARDAARERTSTRP
jgi:RecA/RadA recombinase